MIMTDLLAKKRDGGELTKEEIDEMISEYVKRTIPDYQMSAMCMAILLNGMTEREIFDLTMAMTHSGDMLNLDGIEGIKADKHSTGGVGDKTSLVLCPIMAACGLKIAKMSGRGLGHTGGTIDKLESFPGFVTGITEEQFIENVNKIGIAIAGQTANLDPADKLLYALRDVTGTVPSIPLIVSSIMSKKLAAGADVIVLDVKCGDGSFMKDYESSRQLAEALIKIGNKAGKKCSAVITDMDQPLGYAVGNAIEVKEAIAVLNDEMEGDLLDLCLTIGSRMLVLSGLAKDESDAGVKMITAIKSGAALAKLADMVEAQGGDRSAVYDISKLPAAQYKVDVKSKFRGYVNKIHAEKIGLISMGLGGGRMTKEDDIDLAVGLVLNRKVGDLVEVGDVLATIHGNDEAKIQVAKEALPDCFELCENPVQKPKFIKAIL